MDIIEILSEKNLEEIIKQLRLFKLVYELEVQYNIMKLSTVLSR